MGEDSEGPDVGGRAHPGAPLVHLRPEQLRRGVVGRGESGGVGVGAVQLRRHVEVGQTYRTVAHEQHVGRLQVAVDPARAVQLVQALADLRQHRGPRRRSRVVGEYGVQGALRALQDDDGGPVQLRVVRVVDGQRLEHADEAGGPQPGQHLHLAFGEFAEVAQLARGARAGRQELEGGPAGEGRIRPGGGPGRVDGREGPGRQGLPHLPVPDAVTVRDQDRVRVPTGHPATSDRAAPRAPRAARSPS